MSDIRVKPEHCRAMGYCMREVRVFVKRHGLDLRTFVHEGLPVEDVEAIDDFRAKRIAQYAREQAGE